MSRQRLDQICGTAILGIVLLIVAFGPLMMGATRGQDIAVIGILTTIAATLWGVRLWLRPPTHIAWPPLCFAVLGFMVYALYRYPDAPVEYAARNEVLRILIYALIFFIVLNNATHRSLSVFSYLIIGLGVFMSIYAVYQFMTRSDMVWNLVRPAQYAGRGSGTYICPNHLAGYLEIAIPLGLAQLFVSRKGHVGRVALGYAVLIMLAGMAATISRGGWTSVALGLLVFFSLVIIRRGTRWPALVMLALVLSGAFWFSLSSFAVQRRIDQTTIDGKLHDIRFPIWRAAEAMWKDHFWVGAGPGQFDSLWHEYRPVEVQGRALYVHNDYLNTLCDWGLLGFAIVAAFFIAFHVTAFRIWRALQDTAGDTPMRASNRIAVVVAGLTGIPAVLVHAFVDFNFQIPANAILSFSFMALVGAVGFVSGHVTSLRLNGSGRIALTLILCLAGGWLVPESITKFREGRRLTRSDHPDLPLENEMILLREMVDIEPMNPDSAYRIGEGLRLQNWEKPPGYYARILEAEEWFRRSIRLNPHNAFGHIRLGMCQDLLRDYRSASSSFEKALETDPNGAVTVGHAGWHCLQIDEYAKAERLLKLSLKLNHWDNVFAREQLEIVQLFAPKLDEPAVPEEN